MLKWDNVCYSCLCHSLINRCTFARSPSQKLLMNLPVSLVLFPPAALWKDPTHFGGLGCYKRVSWHHAGDLQSDLFWKVVASPCYRVFFRGSHNWNFHSPCLILRETRDFSSIVSEWSRPSCSIQGLVCPNLSFKWHLRQPSSASPEMASNRLGALNQRNFHLKSSTIQGPPHTKTDIF